MNVHRFVKTPARSGEESRVRFIATELDQGLTFVTVALLAYHLGEEQRGSSALKLAESALSEVQRAMADLPHEESGEITAQAQELSVLLKEVCAERPVFGRDLCQPSMS